MREFEKYEMFKSKCPVCGSKNKVYTELMSITDKFVGYSLKCCNCGNYKQFILDHHSNGKIYNTPNKNGKQHCIQMSYCPKKDCPLYGTCKLKNNAVDFPDNGKKDFQTINDGGSLEDQNTVDMVVLNSPKFL